MADEHAGRVLGCAGHPIVQTPNIDALASHGTRFTACYTDSPICVPARAAFATGLPIHETGNWDNAFPYTGVPDSWGHVLQRNGIPVVSIGKLHYRSADDNTGFDRQILPMHVVNGIGDVLGSVRDPLPVRNKCRDLSRHLGEGDTDYTRFDEQVTGRACDWLRERSAAKDGKPWVAFVSLVCPHFPLVAPKRFMDLYSTADIPLPKPVPVGEQDHPWVKAMRECFIYDRFFDEDSRRLAIASYYALCSLVDDRLGLIVKTLRESGLDDRTNVIYLSDHGDNLGARGLWGKSTFYEESALVPLIMAGPDVPRGKTNATPVALSDMFATILDIMKVDNAGDNDSLFKIANSGTDADRDVLSQYHAAGSASGGYMVRCGSLKYVHYVGMRPQMFDLDEDPEELNDLALDERYSAIMADMKMRLYKKLDPVAVDQNAKSDQRALIRHHGGREAVIDRGTFGPTPIPGADIRYTGG